MGTTPKKSVNLPCHNSCMTTPLLNDSFLKACLRQATDHTPVWLMRQAGRYLPEYCATRAKAGSFMGLATNPDYATEVTIQPLDRFPLDYRFQTMRDAVAQQMLQNFHNDNSHLGFQYH